MKSLTLFLQCVINDIGDMCGVSTTRDLETVTSRVECEGFSFLTITLPAFAKDLERGLELGQVDHAMFRGFSFHGGLPRFLGGFLDLIFDRGTGSLLPFPSEKAVLGIRQICYLFSKILLDCSDARVKAAFSRYREVEQDVAVFSESIDQNLLDRFVRIKTMLFNDLFSAVDEDLHYGRIVPKHGPGSTRDGTIGNAKYLNEVWTDRLEAVFPFSEFGTPVWEVSRATYLDPGAEPPVKVISVPKTLKTPRIIAMEPVWMQYIQQGILESFVSHIREIDVSRLVMGFEDQSPNQEAALKGSISGSLATLDLSDASDRVSLRLVELLLCHHSFLRDAVMACRSTTAELPGGEVIPLSKFASMGSALCFPFEALVFATIMFLGIEDCLERQLTRGDILSLLGEVRAYGDDLIVPSAYAPAVVARLEDFGLKVNRTKSFWTGKFRESCGKDYFMGTDVSVVRVRRVLPSRQQDAEEIVSASSFRNQFFLRFGPGRTVDFLDKLIKRFIPYPFVSRDAPCIGRLGDSVDVQRWDPVLQRPLVKAAVTSSQLPRNEVDGYPALLKFFLKRGDSPSFDVNHLRRSGRPNRLHIKVRWSTPI